MTTEPRGADGVVVVGTGILAAATVAECARQQWAVSVVPPNTDISVTDGLAAIVVVSDPTNVGIQREIQDRAAHGRTPWLPVHVAADRVVIGPLVRPGRPGCPSCVRRREARNVAGARHQRRLHQRRGAEGDQHDDSMISPVLAIAVARITAHELCAVRTESGEARTDGAVLRMSTADGSMRRHRFLPDPTCPRCANLPPDDAAHTVPDRRVLHKRTPTTFRQGSLGDRADELMGRYVDVRTGLVGSVDVRSSGLLPTAVARRAPGAVIHDSQHGYGGGENYLSARGVAIAEALERDAGQYPRGRRTTVRGSYRALAADAVSPLTLGSPPAALYQLPDYPFVPFSEDHETDWVWGHSFQRDSPVLVPRSVAYYGPASGADPVWINESSNGCATGASLAEATLYGLLEVAERDAFLMTWYARLPIPRIDLDSAADRRIPMMAELLAQRFGYQIMAFSSMLEQRVPTVVILAVYRGDMPRPALVCSAGAHVMAEHAALSALSETAMLLGNMVNAFDPESVAPMLADPMLVRELPDHRALYGHSAAGDRLDFLTSVSTTLSLREVTERSGWPSHDNLNDDLDELVGRYLAADMDVITVDITSAEQTSGGFASAKVIVPGALPMTFGHQFRRTENLPRLYTVPRLLGHLDRDLLPDEINPFPHPFP